MRLHTDGCVPGPSSAWNLCCRWPLPGRRRLHASPTSHRRCAPPRPCPQGQAHAGAQLGAAHHPRHGRGNAGERLPSAHSAIVPSGRTCSLQHCRMERLACSAYRCASGTHATAVPQPPPGPAPEALVTPRAEPALAPLCLLPPPAAGCGGCGGGRAGRVQLCGESGGRPAAAADRRCRRVGAAVTPALAHAPGVRLPPAQQPSRLLKPALPPSSSGPAPPCPLVVCKQDARTKWIDGALRQALDEGFTQVVCLAAGYDTRAYRFARRGVKVRPGAGCHLTRAAPSAAEAAHLPHPFLPASLPDTSTLSFYLAPLASSLSWTCPPPASASSGWSSEHRCTPARCRLVSQAPAARPGNIRAQPWPAPSFGWLSSKPPCPLPGPSPASPPCAVHDPRSAAAPFPNARRACLPGYDTLPRPVYVGADLGRVTVGDALAGTGFDASRPTLFTCEGLIYYLPEVLHCTAGCTAAVILPACASGGAAPARRPTTSTTPPVPRRLCRAAWQHWTHCLCPVPVLSCPSLALCRPRWRPC